MKSLVAASRLLVQTKIAGGAQGLSSLFFCLVLGFRVWGFRVSFLPVLVWIWGLGYLRSLGLWVSLFLGVDVVGCASPAQSGARGSMASGLQICVS